MYKETGMLTKRSDLVEFKWNAGRTVNEIFGNEKFMVEKLREGTKANKYTH